MQTKTCFKCLETLAIDMFYRHKDMGDGHLNKCKECTKFDVLKHRLDNIEKVRAYDNSRSVLPHRKAKRIQGTTEYSSKWPQRKKANDAVNNAIRDGKLTRLPCFVCGEKAVAHHPDYDAPLDVVWLCVPHHRQAHAIVSHANNPRRLEARLANID
jgi:hypothetical protein